LSIEFLLTSLIVVLAPGTGVIYTLAVGLGRGARASVLAAFGCTLGILPHIAASVAGLAAILHTSAVAFQALKIAGVIYLLYLAWRTLQEKGALAVDDREGARPRRPLAIVTTGFLINILNPKLSIFFLAFLPQFVALDAASPTLTMLWLGGVFMAMTFAVFVVYGVAASAVRAHVVSRPQVMAWMRRIFAGAFAALGLRLALQER